MSVHIADSQFSFKLPTLSYVDVKWEEPNLRASAVATGLAHTGGLATWLSRQVSAFLTWRREINAAEALSGMSDRELMDIGLSRTDIGRAFDPAHNLDLQRRGLAG